MRHFPWKLIGILLIAWTLLSIRAGDRFADARESAHVWIPAAIRTFDKHGLETVGLMMTRNTAPITSADEIMYYSHHPGMMYWVPLISTRLLGVHEAGIRFPFMAITLLTICLLYLLTRRLCGETIALWTAFFYTIAPYTTYFGRIPAPDVIGFLWVMLYAVVMLDWIRQSKRSQLVALSVLAWLAVWTAWTAVFFIAALGITAMLLGRRQHRIGVIWLGSVCIIAFLALVGFYQLQWDGSINSILEAYVWRSSTAAGKPNAVSFTAFQWVAKNLGHMLIFATIGILLLSLFGILEIAKANRTTKGMIIGLFAGSLTYQLAFLNASYIHDVDKASFTLVLAILAALGVHYWQQPRRQRWGNPLWQALTIVIVVQAFVVTSAMHSSSRAPLLERAFDLAQTAPESTQVAVNMPELDAEVGRVHHMVMQYYTYRLILWGLDEDQARIAAGDQPIFYITCAYEQDDADQTVAVCRAETID